MSLFICDNCKAIENTALCNYWKCNYPGESGKALCSECDPKIRKWHGRFPKEIYNPIKHKNTKFRIIEEAKEIHDYH